MYFLYNYNSLQKIIPHSSSSNSPDQLPISLYIYSYNTRANCDNNVVSLIRVEYQIPMFQERTITENELLIAIHLLVALYTSSKRVRKRVCDSSGERLAASHTRSRQQSGQQSFCSERVGREGGADEGQGREYWPSWWRSLLLQPPLLSRVTPTKKTVRVRLRSTTA